MNIITQISDLKAVSGGYLYTEFVTEDTIFYNSLTSAACVGLLFGLFGYVAGNYLAEQLGAVTLGMLSTTAGASFGYNNNDYSDIEPNTWVTWDVTVVYY